MLPFILLNRDNQTTTIVASLHEVADLLDVNAEVDLTTALANVDTFLDFLDMRVLLDDATIVDQQFLAEQIRPRVLPSYRLGPDINFFRFTLRDHLATRNPFAYAFHSYLLEIVTLARYIDVLPTNHIGALHYSILRGRDENSEYLYETLGVVLDLLQYRQTLIS